MNRFFAAALFSVIPLLASTANAATVVLGNSSLFYQLYSSAEYQQQSFFNGFNASDLTQADEVNSPPSENQGLGPTLTFSNDGIRLRATQAANLVYDDNEFPNGIAADVLSVGDINNDENDNFVFDVIADDVYFFEFQVVDNGDRSRSSEGIEITLSDGSVHDFFTDTPSSFSIGGISGRRYDTFGFVSTGASIKKIFFNEDNGGDDIGLGSYLALSAIEITPVPVPAAAWLFSSALIGLATFKQNKLNY